MDNIARYLSCEMILITCVIVDSPWQSFFNSSVIPNEILSLLPQSKQCRLIITVWLKPRIARMQKVATTMIDYDFLWPFSKGESPDHQKITKTSKILLRIRHHSAMTSQRPSFPVHFSVLFGSQPCVVTLTTFVHVTLITCMLSNFSCQLLLTCCWGAFPCGWGAGDGGRVMGKI